MNKILIGIPTITSIATHTVASLFAATNQMKDIASLNLYTSSLVHDARNKIAQKAVNTGFTHVMFIDSDIEFPSHAIQQLVDHDKDIVGGLYFRKGPPHYPMLSEKVGKKLVFPKKIPGELFKTYAIGTGFLLIKTKVFKDITYPWFYFGKFGEQYMGEDVYFCNKAQRKGFDVWCDPTLDLGHVGPYSYSKIDYEAYRKDLPKDEIELPDEDEL